MAEELLKADDEINDFFEFDDADDDKKNSQVVPARRRFPEKSDSEERSTMSTQSTQESPSYGSVQPVMDVVVENVQSVFQFILAFYAGLWEIFGVTIKYVFWISFIAVPTFGASCVIYYLFYWTLIPQGKFVDPVDFDFTLSPPTDSFYLQQPKWQTFMGIPDGMPPILTREEKYDIILRMTIPTTPEFLDLKETVMVHLTLKNCDGETIAKSARGFVPQYYNSWSRLVHRSMIFMPSALGVYTESTYIWLPLMDHYQESPSNHTCSADISLSEPHLHIYKAELAFDLILTGFRRIIRDWFISSSMVGISSIFFSLMFTNAILFLLSNLETDEETSMKIDAPADNLKED